MKKKFLKRFCLKLIKSTCRFPKKAGINFTRWVVRLLWCMRALRVSPKILYIYILGRMFINRKLLALKDTSLFTDVSNQATVTWVSTKSISRLNWFSQWLVLAICDSGNKPHWRTGFSRHLTQAIFSLPTNHYNFTFWFFNMETSILFDVFSLVSYMLLYAKDNSIFARHK